jgi:hypothetical protein
MITRNSKSYSIDITLPKRITKITKQNKLKSESDFVNEVLTKAVIREESKLKPQTHKKG